ncbi:MAG TPA: hypothetical protein VNH22_08020 [Blastocatellia bacterium]|jgi:YHS domain-containing protein|nr:hypothetical protein [Blastocatellia bacterium]
MKSAISLFIILGVMQAFGPLTKAGGGRAGQGGSPQASEAVAVIEGLDPVMLVQGREVQGDQKIFVIRGRFQYLFANAENKALFEKDPERYEIQLGGSCARMGPPVGGNPDLYTVYKERIYIFGSPDCLKVFKAAPEKFVEPEPSAARAAATPEALKRGRSLIEKAVAATGGAAKLDGLVSYEENAATMQSRPKGDVEVKSTLTVVFPDSIRLERVAPDFRDVSVLTPSDAFTFYRVPRTMPDAVRAERSRYFKRSLLSVLRARNATGFEAAVAGSAKAGDTSVEQVAVSFDGVSLNLGIDPATGRVLSLSYRGRGPDGTVGEVVQTFSDFREVGGLTLPFKVTATHNGQPFRDQSRAVESIIINGQVAPEAFARPKAAQ